MSRRQTPWYERLLLEGLIPGALIVLTLAISGAAMAGFAWCFAWAWNATASAIWGAPRLLWWQAWAGLFLLGTLGRALGLGREKAGAQ